MENNITFREKDVIAITESFVARAYDNYITVDDIANDIRNRFGNNCELILLYPI